MSGTGRPRSYPVPLSIRSAHLGPEATLDQLEAIARHETAAGEWAYGVVSRENQRQLDKVCTMSNLPRGLLASDSQDEDEVIGLINQRGQVWRSSQLGYEPRGTGDYPRDVILSEDEVGYIVRSLDEGREMVVLAATSPVGWLAPIVGAPVTTTPSPVKQLAPGAKVVAVVDDLDKNAVLDLLAVEPGPIVLRRHAGQWLEDDGWVSILRSFKPPPLVEVTPEQQDSVASQVDEATQGQEFVATGAKKLRASGFTYLEDLERETEKAVLYWAVLGATNPAGVVPGGTMPGGFQKYWLFGRGAAKIRWGTPGAWRRCYRNLVKYIGPLRTPGACTNLSKKLGGPGVATHVGVKEKRALKRAVT